MHRIGARQRELHERRAGAHHARPGHRAATGLGRQRERLHLRGDRRRERRRRQPAGGAGTGEPGLADRARWLCPGGVEAGFVRTPQRRAQSRPRLHLRSRQQRDLGHDRHPAHVHQHHGRQHLTAALPHRRHHHVSAARRRSGPAPTYVTRSGRAGRSAALRHRYRRRHGKRDDAGDPARISRKDPASTVRCRSARSRPERRWRRRRRSTCASSSASSNSASPASASRRKRFRRRARRSSARSAAARDRSRGRRPGPTSTAMAPATSRCIARRPVSGSSATSPPCSSATRAMFPFPATTTATASRTSRSSGRPPASGS